MKDSQSRYVYANRLTLELFNCSLEELVGRDDTNFFSTDAAKRLREVDLQVFTGEQTFEEITVDGSEKRIYLEVKTPIYEESEQDTIWGLLGISTDITDRKQVEDDLKKHREHLDELVSERTKTMEKNSRIDDWSRGSDGRTEERHRSPSGATKRCRLATRCKRL